MPSGLFRTVVNIGLKYLAVGVILFQKSTFVVEPYLYILNLGLISGYT